MQKFKNFIYKTMYGRYGVDQFSRFLSIVSLVELALNLLTGWRIFYYLLVVTVIYNCFRIYSRNIYKRQAELNAFLVLKRQADCKTAVYRRMWKERKTHRFFACPSCKTVVRVPKGRGKIEITCPKCHNNFIKKS